MLDDAVFLFGLSPQPSFQRGKDRISLYVRDTEKCAIRAAWNYASAEALQQVVQTFLNIEHCSAVPSIRVEQGQRLPSKHRLLPSANFAAGSFGGQSGIPPRLQYFMSRSIVRPDSLQLPAWNLQSSPEAQTEGLPAEFTEKYVLRRHLGKGSFGIVRSVVDKNTGLEWAAKIMPKKLEGKDPERILKRLREEVDILRKLQRKPETLRLLEVIEDENTLCIVTEVCYGGDLEQLLRERGYLTETEAARVMHAALRVLEECHRNGICYGDVKPANFLLKWPFPSISDPQALPDIRVADFGCAQEIGPGVVKKSAGTPLYVAPEQFMQTIGLESDMWSLGMLFYHLLCGRLPFADSFSGRRSPMDVMMAILSEDVKFEGPRWSLISEGARSLIMRMLDRDYNTRVKPGDALLDPWLTGQCWADDKDDNVCQVFDHPPRNCISGF